MQESWGIPLRAEGTVADLFISAIADTFPELAVVVHDDACHLHRFTERRASDSPQAARLAPPAISYICDAFHMSGHTDAWCKANCNPAAPHLKTLVEGVRTSVCEFTFT
jgi:hypothetical protein